jgi:CxxC motif-containing protein (DUF1111 family)
MHRPLALAALICAASALANQRPIDERERFPGGDTSVTRATDDARAFSQPAANLDFAGEAAFKAGNLLFRRAHPGLGPLFNAQSCQGCHKRDGRGDPVPGTDGAMTSLFLRISVDDGAGGTKPEPNYGEQLQTFGVARSDDNPDGLPRAAAGLAGQAVGEAFGWVEYELVDGKYSDGQAWQLRRPVYRVRELSYGNFAPGVQLSPRLAPPMIGLGLLEAIPAEAIRAAADPDDADGDGISGRARGLVDPATGVALLGRFGHKAGAASVIAQGAGAFRGDMGISNPLARDEACTAQQTACLVAAKAESDAHGGLDIGASELALVSFYARHLAVPARRGWDDARGEWQADIAAGRGHFFALGCASCHRPSWQTGSAPLQPFGVPGLGGLLDKPGQPSAALGGQTIWPWTDLLLHDMGGSCTLAQLGSEADPVWEQRCDGLADDRPEGGAGGREWRTPPLWGLGYAQVINPNAGFLHDGRARTIEEALLWHGGEAQAARDGFVDLPRAAREQLLAFLQSL